MHTLESLRGKIDTASDLSSVVRTMKTLAAVSIRQYERAVEALSAYNRTVELGFQIVLRDASVRDQVFAVAPHGGSRQTGAIIFGTDQGMCGQFNERIAATAQASHVKEDQPWKVLAVGSRVEAHLLELDLSPEQTFSVPSSVSEITDLVQDLLLAVDRWREQSGITRLQVFYNRRITGASCTPSQWQLLPIGRRRYNKWSRRAWDSASLPLFTMDRRHLLSCIVRQYLFVSLFRSCAESLSSENASRISAMQVAEKSIQQRLEELRDSFNRIRQTAITEELLDVVSGFEALSKGRDEWGE